MRLDHLQGERASAPKVSGPTAALAPGSTWLPQPPPGKGAAFSTQVSRPQAQSAPATYLPEASSPGG